MLFLHLAIEPLAQQGHAQRVVIKHGSLQKCDACLTGNPRRARHRLQENCDVHHILGGRVQKQCIMWRGMRAPCCAGWGGSDGQIELASIEAGHSVGIFMADVIILSLFCHQTFILHAASQE